MAALQLDGYQFDEKIGEGGMAAVYRGHQLSLARPVAIKVLNQQLRKHDQVYEAFEREAVIIARLTHPNIIHVIDRGISAEGIPFFIMEYVDGTDLASLLREGALPLQKKIDMCIQTCRALAYAHKNNVIHRDIKPANILVNRDFTIKVLDFGIASFSGADSSAESQSSSALPFTSECTTTPTTPDTSDREVMGTVNYMAPELQDPNVVATAKSDIYSLGVMMFEIFSGHLPSAKERLLPADSVGLPQSIAPIIMACLAEAPTKRPDMSALYNQLLLLSRGSHLDKQKAKRAKESVNNKKSFSLLDIIREGADDAVYLFIEQNSGQQLVVKKFVNDFHGFELGKRLATLAHPNILRVHGTSKNNRACIQVMDYAKGGSLQERLVRPFTLGAFMPVAEQLLRGLMFAHKHQILHSNLRPSNVLFDEHEQVKLVDFGLPPHQRDDAQRTKRQQLRNAAFRVSGEPHCPQADIYACGVIFYLMLLGQFPKYSQGGRFNVSNKFRSANQDDNNGQAVKTFSSPGKMDHSMIHNTSASVQDGQLEITRSFRRLPEPLQALLEDMLQQRLSNRPKKIADVLQRLDLLNENMVTQLSEPSRWSVSLGGAVPNAWSVRRWLMVAFAVVGIGAAALVVGRVNVSEFVPGNFTSLWQSVESPSTLPPEPLP